MSTTLYLIRHSLTEANEKRLYSGATDLPLSPAGVAVAREAAGKLSLPAAAKALSSGMRRADETLALLTGRKAELTLPDLREMDFGAFELRGYDELRHDPAYIRWIEDAGETVRCPGGESTSEFRARALRGGEALLALGEDAVVVCHGGVIVALMQRWFPEARRAYYDWQPGPCGGWRVTVEAGRPAGYATL